MTTLDRGRTADVLPAAEWDALHTAGRRYRIVTTDETDLLTHHLGPGNHQTALDVACGTGDYTAALHHLGWNPTGIDWAPTAINTAETRHPHIDFRVADIETDRLDLPHPRYDLITCRLAWVFMADQAALLDRLHGLLAPGGALHITTPVADRLPAERRGVGITPSEADLLHATGWAEVTVYDLDYLACYVLRRTDTPKELRP